MKAGKSTPPAMAAWQIFLSIWLPMLVVLFTGLWRAWMTGQADPWDWSLPASTVLVMGGFLAGGRFWFLVGWTGVGMAGMILSFCELAAARAPHIWPMTGLILLFILSACGAMALRGEGRRRICGMLLLSLAALLLWRGPSQPIEAVPDRPRLAVITSLPLFWDDGGDRVSDAPIITVLRTRFAVQPIDDPALLPSSGARLLLLAQPRAMPPAALVAIDRWVQDGGRALVLADPLLRWPSSLPLGDRRRAPAVSLLTPLLAHWGFDPGPIREAEFRYAAPDGSLLTLSGASAFRADGHGDGGNWDVRRTAVGKGEVLLLGDADLLDDRLWLADPARPLDPRFWSADTPARVALWLGSSLPMGRVWMRDGVDVASGLRWSVLVGTIWAILGSVLIGRFSGALEMRGRDGEVEEIPEENI